MLNLNIGTGVEEVNFCDGDGNVKCTVYYNPTDPNFIDRIFTAFDALDKKTESYREQVQKEQDNAKILQIARTMDAEMRQVIDELFEAEVCKPLFGHVSLYASSNGLPLWANLMLSVIDNMDDAFAREKKASSPRLKKYTEKFSKGRKAV